MFDLDSHKINHVMLVPGLYESLINELIDARIKEAASNGLHTESRDLESGDSHTYLAQYLSDQILKAFSSIPQTDRVTKQLELTNRILHLLSEETSEALEIGQFRLLRPEL